jgi:hypothetical protein
MANRSALVLLLGALTVLSACTVWKEHKVINNWSDATGGEAFERSLWKDVHDGNWNELDRHLAGNYIAIAPEGRLDRAGAIQHWQKYKLDSYSLGDFQVELNGSTLVVTYNITLHGSFDGQPLPATPIAMMTVWQDQKKGWIAIAHTFAGQSPAPPAR